MPSFPLSSTLTESSPPKAVSIYTDSPSSDLHSRLTAPANLDHLCALPSPSSLRCGKPVLGVRGGNQRSMRTDSQEQCADRSRSSSQEAIRSTFTYNGGDIEGRWHVSYDGYLRRAWREN